MKDRIGAPVFVKVNEYREILDVLDMIKAKIGEVRETLAGINEIRNEEDAEVSMWNTKIDEVEKKISNIDRMMAEME